MKVYLFFNYPREEMLPKHDYWINFRNPDSTKLAIATTLSWERQDWEVERISSDGETGFSQFTGRLQASAALYDLKFFNFWFAAMKVAPAWFTTIDVLNIAFTPRTAQYCVSVAKNFGYECVSPRKGFSAACLWVTPEWCLQAINIIRAYDMGEFAKLESDLVSDETVLRHYGRWHDFNIMTYALAESNWRDGNLIHIPRSVLQHYK